MDLTLEQFKEILDKKVEGFVENYEQGMATQPDIYPSTFSEADWWEQFEAFEGLDD